LTGAATITVGAHADAAVVTGVNVLFVFVFLIEGARWAGYSAFQHPVSSLALGELGWMSRANFSAADPISGYAPGTPMHASTHSSCA
jgi:hypothetical protein